MNPIILRNILKYFPTGFLLSSVSLVCKTWNRVSRTFIRNHRLDVPGAGVFKALLAIQPLNFPKLQELTVSHLCELGKTEQKEVLRTMHSRSLNLKKIYVDSGSLKIV